MSRYMVNKVLYEVDLFDADLAWFKDDPAGFLDDWEARGDVPLEPYHRGGALSDDERTALEQHDWGGLYALGANPFLLWQFARSVTVPDLLTIEDLITSFREAVEPHGYPDYFT